MKKDKEMQKKVKILKEVVNRNKLKDSGVTSIDTMVEVLKQNNITIHKVK